MKTSTKIALAVTAAAAAGIAIYAVRHKRLERILKNVADEGYETARDILYPRNGRGSRLQYGPVIPR